MAQENKRRNFLEMADDDDEEEAGEVIESAPPLSVGQERVFNSTGLKKKLIRSGLGFQTPEFGDEPTGIIIYYSLLNKFQIFFIYFKWVFVIYNGFSLFKLIITSF